MSSIINSLNLSDTAWFLIRFVLNILTLFILVKLLYYEYRKEGVPEYLFAFFLLGVIVFLICTALEMVSIGMGFALGLFALFGILRFRTESIPVREMTYLFLVIGVAMINSLVKFQDVFNGIILSNTLIILPAWILEAFLTRNSYRKKEIIYDNMDDVFDGEEILKEKLTELTGYEIRKLIITRVDLVRRMANITIYYKT
ncbi:MAG: DUF4956 domain-containing protein [Marinilabiliaceae bacterium]|jgi:hypothetical protein|nr:DUF4956 domain-containing protein [Marinilabiliaceae bacterium]